MPNTDSETVNIERNTLTLDDIRYLAEKTRDWPEDCTVDIYQPRNEPPYGTGVAYTQLKITRTTPADKEPQTS